MLVTTSVAGEPGTVVFAVQTGSGGVTVEPVKTVDGTRKQATITLDGALFRLADRRRRRSAAAASTIDRMAVATVIDGVGAAARALELWSSTPRNAFEPSDRVVPGVVQHLLRRTCCVRVELTALPATTLLGRRRRRPRPSVHRGDDGQGVRSDAFPQLGGSAIQVFGGIGFTWEHDIHLFLQAAAVAHTLGSADDARKSSPDLGARRAALIGTATAPDFEANAVGTARVADRGHRHTTTLVERNAAASPRRLEPNCGKARLAPGARFSA